MMDYLHGSIPDLPKEYDSSKLSGILSEICLRRQTRKYLTFYKVEYQANKKIRYNLKEKLRF
jgi:hypothetical protein